MTPTDVVKFAKENHVEFVDFKFTDFPGTWHHFGIPISQFDEDVFEEGLGFDGSSIRGWKSIESSDMIVKPDPTTVRMEPFTMRPTLSLICDVFDPITHEAYSRDPRNVLRKAEAYLLGLGFADTAYFGPEAEFFVFDDVVYEQNQHSGFYALDSIEGAWNTGRDEGPNLGYKPRFGGGYFPAAPSDTLTDLRHDMVVEMEKLGIVIECEHHEVATAGQCEIDMRFSSMRQCADDLMWFKYVVKNVALRNGKTATFMPKPLYGDNGSGMHTHMSLWKDGKPLFAGDRYAGLSEMAMWYIGGVLKHAPAILAFTNPTTNSYRRLVPGYEAPIKLAYSSRNRSAAVRIPMYSHSPKAKRIEFRTPDPSCNGYLAFAAMLMAGLDGIENQIHPGEPQDKNIYALSAEAQAKVPSVPANLAESLRALEGDHEFLLKGGVFTQDVIDKWISYKYEEEVQAMRLRPTPLEFYLYYDC